MPKINKRFKFNIGDLVTIKPGCLNPGIATLGIVVSEAFWRSWSGSAPMYKVHWTKGAYRGATLTHFSDDMRVISKCQK